MNWRVVEPWLKAWWCDRADHRWTYRGYTQRLCLRCGRREDRPGRSATWRISRPPC